MAKNLMGKTRQPSKGERPYITLDQPGGGWRTEVLKTWQADGSKPFARAFCRIVTPFTGASGDLGDTYVDGLKDLIIVDYDRELFGDELTAAQALFGGERWAK